MGTKSRSHRTGSSPPTQMLSGDQGFRKPLNSLTSLFWSMANSGSCPCSSSNPFLLLSFPSSSPSITPSLPPFLPHPPSQRGKDATDAPNEALVTSRSGPGERATLKLAPEKGNADPQGRTPLGHCSSGHGKKRPGGWGQTFDAEKQSTGMPGCHKAQSSTAKWQKGRIKHPSI